ncbi:MAG: EAL domain-containing protein, partial [Rhodocyclaceae bacterium]|nr:EAL domain-containing protein [Rhodocyclaceae bacterium]
YCYQWTPSLLWLLVVSDTIIVLSYFAIPFGLLYFVRKREDLRFNWIFRLFSAFIFACGLTHFFDIWTIWHPDYWLAAFAKLATALVSLATGILLWPLIPRALQLPSTRQLEELVVRLQQEIVQRKTAEAELLRLKEASDERWKFALEGAGDGIWDWNVQTDEVMYSPRWKEMLGFAADEIGTDFHEWEKRVHPDDRSRMLTAARDHIAGQTPGFRSEYRMLGKDDRWLWLLARGKVIGRDADGKPLRMIGTHTDITARVGLNTALQRRNSMYAFLSRINKAIIHAVDEQSLLDEVCRAALDLGGFRLAWIGRVDAASQRVMPAAVAGEARDYIGSAVVHVSADLPTGRGPTGTAIRENRTCVSNDYLTDTRTSPWQEAARRYGIGSNISLPVSGGDFRGAFMAYAGERNYFDDEIVALMEEVAGDISFGLQSLHDKAEHAHAQAQIALHALVFDNSSEAMTITDGDNNIVMVNRAFTELTGYGLDEVRGKNPRLLQSGRQDRDFYRQMWASLQEHGVWQGELWNRRKNGEIYPEWATFNIVRDAGGRIVSHFAVFSDLTQHKAQEELYRLQRFDALTGLPNRILLQDRVHEAIAHARQHERYVALLYINLDHFRFVNETLGHLGGDEALRVIAKRFTSVVRAGGTVSRLSGDTFVVLLDDLNETAAINGIADALLLAAAEPMPVVATEILLSACIGIALFPNDGGNFDTLLQNADSALSKAREGGRNNYYYFTQDLNELAKRSLSMATELHQALEQGWFVLHYQPQVDTTNGQIKAVEALIRMQHPEKGLVPPGDFIAIAEETGMIVPIGAWVIREACRQLKRWQQEGHDKLIMAINLSPLQFSDPRLFATIEETIREEGVDPRLIELEFTESAVMRNVKSTVAVMKKFKDMGIRLSIDDFGTGYSSLNSLKQFPIDQIKIDLSFVRNLTSDPNDASIVKAIVAMSRALGVTTVAEGVETESQAGYLRNMHCDDLQGYYLSRPAPAAEIGKLLGSRQLDERKASGRTLLVVDDEENVLHAVQRLLHGEGYRVLTAASGDEALDLLGKHDVGVILSDQRMPGMSGTELLRRVRTMHPDIVRIILSGYSEVTTITEAINKGEVYKYVTKPWENDDLIALLRKAFVRFEETRQAKPGA